MIVLDTNVLSEMMKASPSAGVARWLAAQPATSLYTTAVTQAETLHGVMLLPAGRRRGAIEKAAEAMFDEDFAGRVLPFGSDAARLYARIAADRRRAGRPISHFDAQIAAIARSARADELGHLARVDQPAVEPRVLRALREHERRALVDLRQQPGGLRRDDRAGAQRLARLRIFAVGHQPREAEERSVGASDEMRLLRALDLARRRIDALDRLPLVPALRRNQAARAAPRVAPHRLPGRRLHARDEARLRRLRLLPPVRHEAPAAGGELELLRVRGPADERDRVGGKDVEAAREGIRVAVPADVPEARDRFFLRAGEAAAHPAYSKAPGMTAARNAGSLRSENSDSTQVALSKVGALRPALSHDRILGARLLHAQQLLAHAQSRFLQIVVRLQSQPEAFRGAEEGGEPQRRIGGERALAEHDLVDAARGHAGSAGERVLADPHGHEELLEQDLAGMDVAQPLCHTRSSSDSRRCPRRPHRPRSSGSRCATGR